MPTPPKKPTLQIPPQEHVHEAHTDCIYSFQLDASTLITASRDTTLRKWNLLTNRLMPPPFAGHTGAVLCCQIDHTQDLVISGSTDATIRVWIFSTGAEVGVLRGHGESVLSLHCPDEEGQEGRWFVSGSKDKSVRLWNRKRITSSEEMPEFLAATFDDEAGIEAFTCLATLTSHVAAVNAVLLHNETLISGSGDRTIHITGLKTGQVTRTFSPFKGGITSMLYSGLENFFVVASSDSTVSVLDLETGEVRGRLTGHTSVVRRVHAERRGERIVTAGYDGSVRIWVKDGQGQWVNEEVLDYGIPTQGLISDANPYVHDYEEGLKRVFDVHVDGERILCSGQGNVIAGWNLDE